MATSIVNKIVTRGFGVSRPVPERAGLVTMGFGDTAVVIIAPEVVSQIRHGRSSEERRRKEEEFRRLVAHAALISVNERAPVRVIEGNQTVANETDPRLNVVVRRIGPTRLFPHGINIVVERVKKK